MQVWNVLQAAGNTGHKNEAKKSPSAHHRTTLSCCIFATKARIDNRKKLVKQQYVLHMSAQYGSLRPINSWDLLASLGYPSKFQRVLHLAFVTAATLLTGGQPNFARCLAISWAATLCIHFRGLLSSDRTLPGAKFTLRPSLAFSYIGSITARQSSSGRQPNFAVWYKEWNYGTFAEGATYIQQGGHHVWHRPTF